MTDFSVDTNRSTEQLLQAIKDAAFYANQAYGIAPMLAPFSALLVNLSNDAAETANKVVRLTKWLLWLTAILLAVTVTLLGYEIFKDEYHPHQGSVSYIPFG
jgi:uncharacterized membrane protein